MAVKILLTSASEVFFLQICLNNNLLKRDKILTYFSQ